KNLLFHLILFFIIGKINFVYGFNVNNEPFYIERVLPKGYVKDGSVDYTDIVQKAINDYEYVVFPNFPVLVNDSGLKVKSNSTLEFQENSLLILKASSKDAYNIIEIHKVENVKILNPKIIGDRETHTGKGGEHGMGIAIRASRNIIIRNARIEDCWGDGIYLGRVINNYDKLGMFTPPENIRIEGAYLIKNRRNAISITAGKNVFIKDIQAINTKGTPPMAGIDIEPNANKDYLEGIILEDIFTKNNRYGIQLCLKKMVGNRSVFVDVVIRNHIDEKSTVGFRVDKFDRKGKTLKGKVKVMNAQWKDNKRGHISFSGTQEKSCPVVFKDVQGKMNNQAVK